MAMRSHRTMMLLSIEPVTQYAWLALAQEYVFVLLS